MADDLELALKVKADIQQALTQLDKLERELKQQGPAAKRATADHSKLAKSLDAEAAAADRTRQATGGIGSAYASAARGLGALIGVHEAWRALKAADYMQQLEARVRLATKAQGDFNAVWEQLVASANANGANLGDTVDLFAGINRAAPEIGATRDQVLEVVNAVQQLGALSGATGSQMSNAMLQFSQAMAGGVVRAEEMNSIIENTPAIAEAIAEGMDTTVGKLRLAVVAGKVLSKDVFEALRKQAPEIAEEFAGLPVSLDRQINSFGNEVGRMLRELDQLLAATKLVGLIIEGNRVLIGKIADTLDALNGDEQESDLLQKQRERLELFRQQREIQREINELQRAQQINPNNALIGAQLSDAQSRLDQIRAQIKAADAELVALNDNALTAGKEGDKAGSGDTGIPNTLAAAIAAQTKANDRIKGLVDQRQKLLNELDALTQRLSGPADIEDKTSSANVFTLNRLRGSAETKFDEGDFAGGLADLERAKGIVEKLAESGEVSKGYLQTQINLVRELADGLKDNQQEIKLEIAPKLKFDAHVVDRGVAQLQAEFARQNPEFKYTPQPDEIAGAERLRAHLTNLQAIAKANPVAIDVVFNQKGGLGEAININVGGQTIEARANQSIEPDLIDALRTEAAKEGAS